VQVITAHKRPFCLHPYRTPLGIDTPCRKCAPCRERDAREWTVRAKAELETHPETWFLTLTFRPGTIRHETNNAKDVTDYVKRLRKHYRGQRLRYFAAPEWGEANGRLHYHILLHCSGKMDRRTLDGQWGQGHSTAKMVTRDGKPNPRYNGYKDPCAYVAKYATKDGGRKRCSNAYGLSAIRNILKQNEGMFCEIFNIDPGYRIESVRTGGASFPRRLLRKALDEIRQPSDLHPLQCDQARS